MIICSSTAGRAGGNRRPLRPAAAPRRCAPVTGCAGRRDHFVRRADRRFFTSPAFSELYAGWRIRPQPLRRAVKTPRRDCRSGWRPWWGRAGQRSLWRLKDLCHRIWPQERAERARRSRGLADETRCSRRWLKEDLYLLAAYRRPRPPSAASPTGMRDVRTRPLRAWSTFMPMVGRIAGSVDGQMGASAFCSLRPPSCCAMLPELATTRWCSACCRRWKRWRNWGESLEDLFADTFGGSPAVGFCLIGSATCRAGGTGRRLLPTGGHLPVTGRVLRRCGAHRGDSSGIGRRQRCRR